MLTQQSLTQPVSDVLAVLSSLLDKSGELNDETMRIARATQSRRTPGDAAEIRRLVEAGIDRGALELLAAPVAGKQADGRSPLILALAECACGAGGSCLVWWFALISCFKPLCGVCEERCCCFFFSQVRRPFPCPFPPLSLPRACGSEHLKWWLNPHPPPPGRDAASGLDALHENRDQVVEARVAAMEQREGALAAARSALREELNAAAVAGDALHKQALIDADARHSAAAALAAPVSSASPANGP